MPQTECRCWITRRDPDGTRRTCTCETHSAFARRTEYCGFIDRHEETRYAIERRTAHEILHHLMEARGLTHKDVWTLFGSKGIASEVLNGKRAISKTHARALTEFFHVSGDLFIDPESAPRRAS